MLKTKRVKKENELPPYDMIRDAVGGDIDAIESDIFLNTLLNASLILLPNILNSFIIICPFLIISF